MSESFEVGVLARREEIAALQEEWLGLWERCAAATSFQRPEWLLPWCMELGQEEILTITCRSGGRLVGLAPLGVHRSGEERILRPLGAGVTDYNDILAAKGMEPQVVAAVLACLEEKAEAWDLLDFEQLRPGSPLLAAGAPAGWRDVIETQDACPALEIPEGAGLDDVLPPALLAQLSRARRKLARIGAPRLELASAASVEELLEGLFETHRARWNDRGAEGVLDRSLHGFHLAVARGMLARGVLRLFALRLGDQIIATLYAFADRDEFSCYMQGFDPVFAQYSPGVQVIAGAIEHAIQHGARTIDFLRGREPYKYCWGAVDRWTYRRKLRRPGGRRAGAGGRRTRTGTAKRYGLPATGAASAE